MPSMAMALDPSVLQQGDQTHGVLSVLDISLPGPENIDFPLAVHTLSV